MKIIDFLVSIYDAFPKWAKALSIIIWSYLGIRYIIHDILFFIEKFF